MVFKTIVKDIMLWGQKKATKKEIENFIKDEEIEGFLNDDSDDEEKPVKKTKKKTKYIDGEDYGIEDLEMLNSEFDRLSAEVDEIYNTDGDMDKADKIDDQLEKIRELIDGLETLKRMSGKGFKKGSAEAKEWAKKMAEARKAKAKPKPVKEKKEKKVKGKPYYFIDKIPKGYREATEEEAIKAGKVGVLGKYEVDNVKYDMYLKYKILLSDKNDDGSEKSNNIINANMAGLNTRINKLLKKAEVEKTKKELDKYNEYDELKEEISIVGKAYNWYNKLYSKKNNIPYVKKVFKYQTPEIKATKTKELEVYKKPVPIDPRTNKPVDYNEYEEDDEYIFESDGKVFNLKKSYFDDMVLKDKYADKLFKKGFILLPEYYGEKVKNKLFGKIKGSGIFSTDGLKKAFVGFTPLSQIHKPPVLSAIERIDDNVGEYPKYVSNLIKKYGNNNIVKIQVGRTPIQTAISKLMNVMMLGKLDKRMERKGYDDLFHLRLIAHLDNGKTLTIEKNERINMTVNEGRRKAKNEEIIDINQQFNDLTVNDLLEGAKRVQGDKFFKYSASDNNCQDFVMALLQGNNIGDNSVYEFVKQDVEDLFNKYGYMKKIQDKVTNIAGKFNQLVYGGRIKMRKLGNPFKKVVDKSGIKGAIKKSNKKTGLTKGYDKLQTGMTNIVSRGNKKTTDKAMKESNKSKINPFNDKGFTDLGRKAGDLTWYYALPAAVQAGKHLYDATAATASTMLTGNPEAGKKASAYLWDTMVADEGNDLRKNQKSKTLGFIADEAGKAGAKALTGNMTGEGAKRKRGRPRKTKKPVEVVIKTPLDYELFTHSNNASLKQLLESKRRKQTGDLSKNVDLMAKYIKNDVDNVKKEIQQLKNEREFYKGALGAGIKKSSNWIQHCKDYAKKHNVSYKQAMKDAKATYKK